MRRLFFMRKIFLSIASLAAFVFLGLSSRTPIFYDAKGTVTYYCNKKSSNCSMVTVCADYESTFRSLRNVKGECAEEVDKEYVDKIISRLKAKKQFSEVVDGITCDYYYTSAIKDYVVIGGKRVNLHSARRGDVYSIATPMIFGSY